MATIGTAGAPSQNTVNYDALLSTTLAAYRQTMIDNIFRASALLSFLRAYGGLTTQNGGERIAQPLMYGKNTTAKSYSGYEVLDTTPQDGMTTAFYEWRQLSDSIAISGEEEKKNKGEAALTKLLEKKILQAEMTLKELLNEQMVAGTISGGTFVPGNDNKDILPLLYFLSKLNGTNPTIGGNVGNISRAVANAQGTNWWRHKTAVLDNASADTGNSFSMAVTTFAGLNRAFRSMYNYCSRGADGSGPNLVLTDQVTYETYEASLDAKVMYTNTKMADMGFDNVKLKGATVLWEEVMPDLDQGVAAGGANFTGTAAFLNTKFLQLVVESDTDFVTTPFVRPADVDAKIAQILWMGNLTCSNMAKQGVCYAISQGITS